MGSIPNTSAYRRFNMGGKDLVGKPVSEEEVAKGLGFSSVDELRRWDTEMGQKVSDLEYKLSQANSDKENFKWTGLRMMKVLEMVEPLLAQMNESYLPPKPEITEKLKAVRVVLGKEVDWGNTLEWLWERNNGK
jgi:hypothetical protein